MGSNGRTVVQILGEREVRLPGFAVRHELLAAAEEVFDSQAPATLRLAAAMVCLCTDLGAEHRLDYLRAKCDPLAYGGAAVEVLYKAGVTQVEILTAAQPILRLLHGGGFPTIQEVEKTQGFSDAAKGGQTEKPSS